MFELYGLQCTYQFANGDPELADVRVIFRVQYKDRPVDDYQSRVAEREVWASVRRKDVAFPKRGDVIVVEDDACSDYLLFESKTFTVERNLREFTDSFRSELVVCA